MFARHENALELSKNDLCRSNPFNQAVIASHLNAFVFIGLYVAKQSRKSVKCFFIFLDFKVWPAAKYYCGNAKHSRTQINNKIFEYIPHLGKGFRQQG